jgi:hypothetical protein
VLGRHTRIVCRLKRSLRVTEYSRGKTVQRRHRETKLLKDSVELCQVGIERVQGVHKGTLFQFKEKRSVKEKTLTELLNTLSTQQGVLEHKFPRGNLYPFKERKGSRVVEHSGERPVQGVHQAKTQTKC